MLEILTKLLTLRSRTLREPQTHDYSQPRWGHNAFVFFEENEKGVVRLAGHGNGIFNGDFVVLYSGSKYEVLDIEYKRDPRDQWFADAKLVEAGT